MREEYICVYYSVPDLTDGCGKEETESFQRDQSCWETNSETKREREDGGWKCETEGEGKVMEVRKERIENRNIWHFYLLLI